ncbi:PaaI family thioesterase [Tabrizicola sp. J26]|uniref:PaaI family thioesterase n=1 Tax=Alitabrizicola rongguiensis TaxID=2909234 RepID=UPI001F165663|nr:PaaI family thioesterase [Tabrizicola rongguiensis]MCF1708360.1 PaaI family thioesterase [Tabrizicola rongguiensis]
MTEMTPEALQHFFETEFPQAAADFRIEGHDGLDFVLRLPVTERHLRPGGTVSGPTIFGLADVAIYLAILSRIGPVALAVTTGASIDFLRKPEPGRDLLARVRILKLGRALAVADALVFSDGRDEPVARASMTYSIPPSR